MSEDNQENKQLNTNVSKEETKQDSDTDSLQDADPQSTMKAMMEYNRQLLQRIRDLEMDLKKKPSKPKKDEKPSGTNHTFEFPIGEMLESYGSLNTSDLPDNPPEEEEQENVNSEIPESGNIRISDGEKDDIVVKVDATRKGITLTLHIPRN